MELYLHSPIYLHGMRYILMVWNLVKHRDSFTFTFTLPTRPLNELYFWTLSIVWCLKKLRNKNIYIKNHNTHVQNSHKGQLLTTEPLTWVHTQHKPLRQVRHWWQQMTQPLHTSQLLKPGKHKYRIQTKAHAHPHTP
jgi:hypothetical protein